MILELDIWRSANLYVKRYGDDAAVHAAMQADRFLDAGDLDGAADGAGSWPLSRSFRGPSRPGPCSREHLSLSPIGPLETYMPTRFRLAEHCG